MKPFTRVADFMTSNPHWIDLDESLAAAEQRMKKLRVRQLPVLHDGTLRGIISERDVSLVRSLELDPREVSLAEALAVEPYTVSPNAPLSRVARAMAAHRYTCAVVVDEGNVRGILTTSDTLRALAELLERSESESHQLSPRQVREMILAEHAHLRQLLDITLTSARKVLDGSCGETELVHMRNAARAALTALVSHTQLEDQMVAPVLETIDAWGRARARQLRSEHVEQRKALEAFLLKLDEQRPADASLAPAVIALLSKIFDDMAREERNELSHELFSDDGTRTASEGG
jgi:acetoin utilization protein AcuB